MTEKAHRVVGQQRDKFFKFFTFWRPVTDVNEAQPVQRVNRRELHLKLRPSACIYASLPFSEHAGK